MKNLSRYIIIILFCLPATIFASDWKAVLNKDWQAVDQYRAHNYAPAYQQFSQNKSSDGQYNAGNAAAFMGRYQEALAAYDKAIALNPKNSDAIFNRDIIKKILNKQQQKQQNQQNQQQSQQQNKQQNKQQNQQQQASANNNHDKQNKSQQSKQQSAQNNSSQNKQDDNKQNSQNQNQQNQSAQNNNQNNSNQPQPTKNNDKMSQAMNNSQNQDESKKQMLRRISDDPGGLLKQKFMRDYMRRHTIEESSDQGDN